jgi:hypothetical protein
MKVELPEKIYDEIKEYCRVNNIDDVDKFIRKILNQGFTTEKWGVIGENKEPKKEIVEKIIISAITVEPEIKVVEKIIYSATSEPEIKIVEKIIVSATTNEITKYVNTGESITHIYNVYVKPESQKKIINKPNDNIDLYGERNIRKT